MARTLGTGIRVASGIAQTLSGVGDYSVGPAPADITANSLVRPLPGPLVPHMHSSAQGIRVTHREYIADMTVGTFASPFTSQFVLNPGDSRVFPWLSQVARNFTQWIPMGMAFEMKSTVLSGVNSANPQYGTFNMATNYDVYASLFGNDRVRMLNHFFASSAGPLDSQLHLIECSPDQTPLKLLFVRPQGGLETEVKAVESEGGIFTVADYSATYDARLYDLGRLEVLGINAPAGGTGYVVGELWVSYDIMLLKPVINTSAGYTYQSAFTTTPITQELVVRDEITLAISDISVTLPVVGP